MYMYMYEYINVAARHITMVHQKCYQTSSEIACTVYMYCTCTVHVHVYTCMHVHVHVYNCRAHHLAGLREVLHSGGATTLLGQTEEHSSRVGSWDGGGNSDYEPPWTVQCYIHCTCTCTYVQSLRQGKEGNYA